MAPRHIGYGLPIRLIRGSSGVLTKAPGTTLEFALAIVRMAKGAEIEKALREGMVIANCECDDNCTCGCNN